MDYGKIEWYCSGIKRFTCGSCSVLKEMVEYSLVKVTPKDIVSTFFDKDFKCF